MNRTLPGIACGLGASSIWGGMYVVSKVVLEVVPPFTLLVMRLSLGFLALLTALVLRGTYSPVSKRQFAQSFIVGILGYGVSLGFQFTGTKLSTASNGALITSATPAFVLLFALWLLKEKISTRRMLSLAISSIGVLAVIDPRTAQLSPTLFQGNILLFLAGLTWALYSVLVRKIALQGDLLVSSAVMLLGGLPSAFVFGLIEVNTRGIGTITTGIFAGILFLGIISTAIAMFLWNYAFSVLPASIASLTFFAQPIVGTMLGWLFLREKITPLFLLGSFLIGIGIYISTKET